MLAVVRGEEKEEEKKPRASSRRAINTRFATRNRVWTLKIVTQSQVRHKDRGIKQGNFTLHMCKPQAPHLTSHPLEQTDIVDTCTQLSLIERYLDD